MTERIYTVKWTDVSQGYHFPCVKENLTLEQAIDILWGFWERWKRYYKGAMEPYCPFRYVKLEWE